MLSSLMKSVFPVRVLFPLRRRFRDRPVAKAGSDVSMVRLFSFLLGGIVLASLVLMASATLRSDAAQAPQAADLKRGPAAAVAARPMKAAAPETDGRAIAETAEAEPREPENRPAPAFAQIDRACAEHAREKLMIGLTQYYLQQRLRPGAGPEDVADTSSLTGLLAGPGDPAATTPGTACHG